MTVVTRIKQYALLLLLFITAVTSYFGFLCYEIYMKPLMHYGVPSEFTINKKETIRQVARRMRSNGYIRSSELTGPYITVGAHPSSNLAYGFFFIDSKLTWHTIMHQRLHVYFITQKSKIACHSSYE